MTIGDIQNQNDSALGSKDYRPPVDPTNTPTDGEILAWSEAEKAYIPQPSVTTAGFVITDDAGNGTVWDDCNNTDFTGQNPVIGQAASLAVSSINTFAHKSVAYNWIGATGVTVGLGGNYVATAADFVGIGTADHNILVNRNQPNQHETADITGLDAEQNAQDVATALVQTNLTNHISDSGNPHNTLHSQLSDSGDANLHPTSSISGLDTKQQDQDDATALVQANLDAHVAAPDPHPQYATETAVLDNFVGAGYGGIGQNAVTGLPSLGAGWVEYTGFDTTLMPTPRYITQDFTNNALIFLREGVWLLTVKLTMSHNSSNSGRQVNLRFLNKTTGQPSPTQFAFGIGRNVEVTNFNIPAIPVDVPAESVNDQWVIEIGAGDSVTSVTALGGFFSAVHVGEFQGL